MNKKITILILILLTLLTSCTGKDTITNKTQEEELDFEVEKIQMTKSYQNITPYAEIKSNIENDSNLAILVSAGLTESEGLKVDRVTKEDNQIKIHITNLYGDNNILAVPQALVLLKNQDLNLKDNIKFVVENTEENQIDLKISMDDAINKLNSEYQLSSLTRAKVNLIREDDKLYWDIFYDAIFDKSEKQLPIISLRAILDTNTGDVIRLESNHLAEAIDEGNIVNYDTDKVILYKKNTPSNVEEKNLEELWSYNLDNKQKTLLFKSENTIINTQIRSDLKFISFIENKKGANNLYIVPKSSNNAFKVAIEEEINPSLSAWVGNDLYLIENNKDKANVYKYSLNDDSLDLVSKLDFHVENFNYQSNYFILGESVEESLNKKIYITKDFNNIKDIGYGFNVKLKNNTILYIEDLENSEDNLIKKYNINSDSHEEIYSGLVNSFQLINDEIVYPVKLKSDNLYSIYSQNINSDDNEEIHTCFTNKLYSNKNKTLFYINISSPLEKEKNMLIYKHKIKPLIN